MMLSNTIVEIIILRCSFVFCQYMLLRLLPVGGFDLVHCFYSVAAFVPVLSVGRYLFIVVVITKSLDS